MLSGEAPGQQRDERNKRPPAHQHHWGSSSASGHPRGWGAPGGRQDLTHILQQGGFCLPIPAGSTGLCAGRGPAHTAVLPAARSWEPLVALQELLPAGRSLTRLQGQPPLASAQAPGEQPGALSKAESPLATPQILRLPVKGRSSPCSPPRGCSPASWLPEQLEMKHKPGWVIARGSSACQLAARSALGPGVLPHLCSERPRSPCSPRSQHPSGAAGCSAPAPGAAAPGSSESGAARGGGTPRGGPKV